MKLAFLSIFAAFHSGGAFHIRPLVPSLSGHALGRRIQPSSPHSKTTNRINVTPYAGSISQQSHPTHLLSSTERDSDSSSPTTAPSKAESILEEFHQSNLPFRIVVIGNGAILETTTPLGPKLSSSVSPKTGDKLWTFASDDKSFECHVKVDTIRKISFVAAERTLPEGGSKVMRVSRFLNGDGVSMCSLILADSSAEAVDWFEGMVQRHGQEVVV